MAALELQAVRKSYGTTAILHGIDLQIHDGEFIIFVGPSGCGKSTLLRSIAGLEEISSGAITIDNVDVSNASPSDRGIAMVFQNYALYPYMSVFDNMAFGLKLSGMGKAEIDKTVRQVAATLKIDNLLERKPKALSGGQRQRVAIGRAIVRKPKVFLFDEPLSNLDASLRVQMRLELANLHRLLKTTMIYVTHDQVEAMTLADRIVVLNGGKLEQVGAPLDLYRHPKNKFVAGFLGSPNMNFIPATVLSLLPDQLNMLLPSAQQVRVDMAADVSAGEQITIGIRPELLVLNDTQGLPASVIAVEKLGDVSYVYVQLTDQEQVLITRAETERNWALGQSVYVDLQASSLQLFNAQGNFCGERFHAKSSH